MENDMSKLMNQISDMINNNQIPDDLKNILNSMSNNSQQPQNDKNISSDFTSSKNTSSNNDFDIDTILKMKSIIDNLTSNNNDPRANLLKSLKPYLKESRQSKVDQYIKLINIGKVLETLSPSGGENSK